VDCSHPRTGWSVATLRLRRAFRNEALGASLHSLLISGVSLDRRHLTRPFIAQRSRSRWNSGWCNGEPTAPVCA
jgi:hypothetical protein